MCERYITKNSDNPCILLCFLMLLIYILFVGFDNCFVLVFFDFYGGHWIWCFFDWNWSWCFCSII